MPLPNLLRYIRGLIKESIKSSWVAANGLFGAALAGAAVTGAFAAAAVAASAASSAASALFRPDGAVTVAIVKSRSVMLGLTFSGSLTWLTWIESPTSNPVRSIVSPMAKPLMLSVPRPDAEPLPDAISCSTSQGSS